MMLLAKKRFWLLLQYFVSYVITPEELRLQILWDQDPESFAGYVM